MEWDGGGRNEQNAVGCKEQERMKKMHRIQSCLVQ